MQNFGGNSGCANPTVLQRPLVSYPQSTAADVIFQGNDWSSIRRSIGPEEWVKRICPTPTPLPDEAVHLYK